MTDASSEEDVSLTWKCQAYCCDCLHSLAPSHASSSLFLTPVPQSSLALLETERKQIKVFLLSVFLPPPVTPPHSVPQKHSRDTHLNGGGLLPSASDPSWMREQTELEHPHCTHTTPAKLTVTPDSQCNASCMASHLCNYSIGTLKQYLTSK